MENRTSQPADDRSTQAQEYTVGYRSEATDFLAARRATTQAAFFLPHLSSGMRLLDCGCGPGTITVDLAEIVAPAEVVGIDIENSQIELARAHADRQGVSNIRFEVADIYELPLEDASFDAVFIHGVPEHLSEPLRALVEVRRVMKSGGIVGARHADYDGFLLAPAVPLLDQSWALFKKVMRHNGADPRSGRNQLGVMREAGFDRVTVSAFHDCWTSTREATRGTAAAVASQFLDPEYADRAIALGFVDRSTLERMGAAWLAWGEDPGAFAAEAWGEAVAWKDQGGHKDHRSQEPQKGQVQARCGFWAAGPGVRREPGSQLFRDRIRYCSGIG